MQEKRGGEILRATRVSTAQIIFHTRIHTHFIPVCGGILLITRVDFFRRTTHIFCVLAKNPNEKSVFLKEFNVRYICFCFRWVREEYRGESCCYPCTRRARTHRCPPPPWQHNCDRGSFPLFFRLSQWTGEELR